MFECNVLLEEMMQMGLSLGNAQLVLASYFSTAFITNSGVDGNNRDLTKVELFQIAPCLSTVKGAYPAKTEHQDFRQGTLNNGHKKELPLIMGVLVFSKFIIL